MVLCCSRHMFVRPVIRMDQRAWTECHVAAFGFFGGVPARLVPDNLKTGVDRPDLYDPKINRSYAELAAHYGCLVDPARSRKPRDKPQVERPMPYIRDSLWRGREFASLTQMQAEAVRWCTEVAGQRHCRPLDGAAPAAVFAAVEKDRLAALPRGPFVVAEWSRCKVGPDIHASVAKVLYSIPWQHIGKTLDVRLTSSMAQFFEHGELVKTHIRVARGKQTDLADYLLVTWNQGPGGGVVRYGLASNLGESIVAFGEKWPVLGRHELAAGWLRIWADLGRAPRTIDAYARGLAEYLEVCEREGVEPATANRAHVAVFVRELTSRPSRRGANVVSIDSGAGLSNATIQQRLVPVRLFYDHLIEEGLRESNPVGRGKYTPGRRFGGHERGLVPRLVKLPWIPDEQQWLAILQAAAGEPVRNRVMLALAYDAALRREELCLLGTEDVDPGRRTLRVKAENTKNRMERVVPYSAATGMLLSAYLAHRAGISRARGPLFLSESRRNHGKPLTLWTWSKVVRRIAVDAGVPRFSAHTTRHLCLTDLARMGWELHAISAFAGHRSSESTLRYIHLSGRDLAEKLTRSMDHVHAWRVEALTRMEAAGRAGG